MSYKENYKEKVITVGKYKIYPTNANYGWNPSFYISKEGIAKTMYCFTPESEVDYMENTTMAALKTFIDRFRFKIEHVSRKNVVIVSNNSKR